HRLVGEGSDELNLLVSEWAHRISSQRDGPNRHSFPQEWDSKKRAKAARLQGSRIRVFRIDQNVGNMDDFAIKQDTPRHRCSVDSSWVTGHELGLFMRQPVTRLEVVSFAPRPTYDGHLRLTQPCRRLDQRVEHGLQVEGRAADDLQHVGGGGLLLQRLAQFVEQAGILNGNDGLGGEVLEQLDLFVGERPHLLTKNDDRTHQRVVLDHRYHE